MSYPVHPYQKYLANRDTFIKNDAADMSRTAKSLDQALRNSEAPYILITPCQLMCLSRVGSLNKFRLEALSHYLDSNFGISIARMTSHKSYYIVTKTKGVQLQTDDQLMIEPGDRNLCERDPELMKGNLDID